MGAVELVRKGLEMRGGTKIIEWISGIPCQEPYLMLESKISDFRRVILLINAGGLTCLSVCMCTSTRPLLKLLYLVIIKHSHFPYWCPLLITFEVGRWSPFILVVYVSEVKHEWGKTEGSVVCSHNYYFNNSILIQNLFSKACK